MRIIHLVAVFALFGLLATCKSSLTNSFCGGGVIDTAFTVNTAQTPYPGELLWKARWKEGRQHFIVLLSHQLKDREGEGTDALFARRFIQSKKTWTPQWVYRDTIHGMGCDLGIGLMKPFTEVSDLDSDGRMEFLLTYSRENRCDASIAETCMVLNKGSRSGRIEGFSQLFLGPPEAMMNKFLRENGQDTVRYKTIQSDFSAMGTTLENTASEKWDAMLDWQAKQNAPK